MSIHSRYRAGLWHPYEKPMYGVLLNPYHPLSHGLVGCWLFNESGGNNIFDLSGYGNHGTLGGGTAGYCPSWVVGKFGSALDFDGSNDYTDCGNDTSLDLTHFTIDLWAHPTIHDSKYRVVIAKAKTSADYDGFLVEDYDGSLRVYITSASYQINYVNFWTLNEWQHFALTYDGDVVTAYKNGVKKTDASIGLKNLVTTEHLVIGTRAPSLITDRCFAGHIDIVRIYNRVLSPEEIWQLYTDPFCMFYHPLEAELLYAAPAAGIVPQAMHHYRMMREV